MRPLNLVRLLRLSIRRQCAVDFIHLPRRKRLEDRTERAGQSFDVSFEAGVRNLDILPASEALKLSGKSLAFGIRAPSTRTGITRIATLEHSLDLDANKIIGIVNAPPPIILVRGNPISSDDRNERVASGDAFVQGVEPIHANFDTVDIEKDVFAPYLLRDPIVNRARGERRLFAPLTNEDAA